MEFHIDRQDIKEFKNVYRGSKFDIKVKQKLGFLYYQRVYKHKGMWICALVSLFLLMSTSQFVTDVYIQSPEGIKKKLLEMSFTRLE